MPRSRRSRRVIKEWGWTTPALVGEDGGLIAGHARILAARQLGIGEIEMRRARAADPEAWQLGYDLSTRRYEKAYGSH